MSKTRKSKSSNKSKPQGGSSTSVRSKIGNIEEGFGAFSGVISDLRDINALTEEHSKNIRFSTDQFVIGINIVIPMLARIDANIKSMTQAMLGFDVTDREGNKVEIKGMKVQGGGAAMKEQAAEDKKEDDQDDERNQNILKYSKLTAEQLKELTGILKGGSFLDILIMGGAVLAGFVTGVVQQIMVFFKPVGKLIQKIGGLFTKEGTVLSKLITGVGKGFEGFVRVIKSIGDFVYKFSGMQKVIGTIGTAISSVVSYVVKASKGFFSAINTLADFFAMVFGKGKAAVGIFSKFFSYFDDIIAVIKPVFNIAKVIGSKFLKFIPVLGILISIFDTVMGAFKGFTETEGTLVDKLIGGLKGGITGFLNGLFGGLLDLLKDVVSWALSGLGFEDAAKALDSFSFKDIIASAVNDIVEFFMTPVRIIQDIIAAMKGEISWSDMFKSMLGRLVTSVLAPVNFLGKAIGYNITDKVLDLLGLPKAQQGAVSGSTEKTGTPTKALEKTTDENLAAKDEQAAKSTGTTAVVNTNNSPIINNNTSSTAIIKAKTTNWEPDDQWARGGMAWGA